MECGRANLQRLTRRQRAPGEAQIADAPRRRRCVTLDHPQGLGREKDVERESPISASSLAFCGAPKRWLLAGAFGYGETRTRTGDTTIFSRVLYQLSYLAAELRPVAMLSALRPRERVGGRGRSARPARPGAGRLRPRAHFPDCSQASRYGNGSIECPPAACQPPTHISKCRCAPAASPLCPA
jgi:hypothetical protein